MQQTIPIPHPEDKRWRLVVGTMRRHGFASDALIETIHMVQSSFGYVDEEALSFVAGNLRVPLSKAYGVATFYNYFTMKPQGEHACVVCMGTACYIKNGGEVLKQAGEAAEIKAGETTQDKKVSLLVARCLGMCGLAPVATFDGEVVAKVEPSEAAAKVKGWLES